MSQKRHSSFEVLTVTQLTVGLSLFVAAGDTGPGGGQGSTAYGSCLLMAFLAFDSFTSNFQEKLFKEERPRVDDSRCIDSSIYKLYVSLGSDLADLAAERPGSLEGQPLPYSGRG